MAKLAATNPKATSVGVVGAGTIARKLHIPILLNLPAVKLEWVCDRDERLACEVGAAYGVLGVAARDPADLPPTDIVLLAIPTEARRTYLDEFARRRTAVLCEKPFATDSEEHQRVMALFDAHRLGCGYMRRFYGSTVTLLHLVQEQWFGDLLRVRIAEGGRSRGSGSDASFLDSPQPSHAHGVLTDLGSHSIDLALQLTRAKAWRVNDCALELDGLVDRRAVARVALFRDEEGVGRPIELDYYVSWLDPQPNRLELHFERAVVFCGVSPDADVLIGNPERPTRAFRLVAPAQGAKTANQAFYLEWRSFLDGVSNQAESSISARSAYLTTALVEALHSHGRRRYA